VFIKPWDIYRLIKGNNVSLNAMNAELLRLDMRSLDLSVDVLMFFFLVCRFKIDAENHLLLAK